MQPIDFRPLAETDFPRLAEWLRRPHVQEWWKDSTAPDRVREKYLPRVNGDDPTDVFVLLLDGAAIGFIQSYRIADHPEWARTVVGAGLTFPSAAGIDYVIGEPDLIGRGIGSTAIAQFTTRVFADYPEVDCIVVTPQAANRASCRVLEKAGYALSWTGLLDSDDPADAGPAALYVRTRDPSLWPEVDRVALCVHRPASASSDFRDLVRALDIHAGSMIVSAARHLAAGSVTLEQLELISRYESRTIVRRNAQHHVELGLLRQVAEDAFVPSDAFQRGAQAVLDIQGRVAEELWAPAGDLADIAALSATVVASVAASMVTPTPAFHAQIADHNTAPRTTAGQLLAYVTELRYFRSDLHAHALSAQGLAGPVARAVDQLWKRHEVSSEDVHRLQQRGLVEERGEGWRLTVAARAARVRAELDTDALTRAAFANLPVETMAELHRALRRLPGDDPRPAGTR